MSSKRDRLPGIDLYAPQRPKQRQLPRSSSATASARRVDRIPANENGKTRSSQSGRSLDRNEAQVSSAATPRGTRTTSPRHDPAANAVRFSDGSRAQYRHPLLHPTHHFHGRRRAAFHPRPPTHPTTVQLEAACQTLRSIVSASERSRQQPSVENTEAPTSDKALQRRRVLHALISLADDDRTKRPNFFSRCAAPGLHPASRPSSGPGTGADAVATALSPDSSDTRDDDATAVTAELSSSSRTDPLTIDVSPMLGDAEALAVVDAFIESTPNLERLVLGTVPAERNSQLALRNIFSALSRNVSILRVEGDVPQRAARAIDAALADNQKFRAQHLERKAEEAREAAIAAKESEIVHDRRERQNRLFDLWRERTECVDTQKKEHRALTRAESDARLELLRAETDSRRGAQQRAATRVGRWVAQVAALEGGMDAARAGSTADEMNARADLAEAQAAELRALKLFLLERRRELRRRLAALSDDEHACRAELRHLERTEWRSSTGGMRSIIDAEWERIAAARLERERQQREEEAAARARTQWQRQCASERERVWNECREGRCEVESAQQRGWDFIARANFEGATSAKIRTQQRRVLERRREAFLAADARLPRITLRADQPRVLTYPMNPHARTLPLLQGVQFSVTLEDVEELSEVQQARKLEVVSGYITVRSPHRFKDREGVTLIIPDRPLANPLDPHQYAELTPLDCRGSSGDGDRPGAGMGAPTAIELRARLRISKNGRRIYWVTREVAESRRSAMEVGSCFGTSLGAAASVGPSDEELEGDPELYQPIGRVLRGAMKAGRFVDPSTIKVTKSVIVDTRMPFQFATDDEEALFNDEYDANTRATPLFMQSSTSYRPQGATGGGGRSVPGLADDDVADGNERSRKPPLGSPIVSFSNAQHASPVTTVHSTSGAEVEESSFGPLHDEFGDAGPSTPRGLSNGPPSLSLPHRYHQQHSAAAPSFRWFGDARSCSNSGLLESGNGNNHLFRLELFAGTPIDAVHALLLSVAYLNGSETGYDASAEKEKVLSLGCELGLTFRRSCIDPNDCDACLPAGLERAPVDPAANVTPLVLKSTSVSVRLVHPMIAAPPSRTQLFIEEAEPMPIVDCFCMTRIDEVGEIVRWAGNTNVDMAPAVQQQFSIQGVTLELAVVNHDGGDVFKLPEGSSIQLAQLEDAAAPIDQRRRQMRFNDRWIANVVGPLLTHDEYAALKAEPHHTDRCLYAPVLITLLRDSGVTLSFFATLLRSLMYGSLTVDPHPNQRSIDIRVADRGGAVGYLRRRLKVVPVDDVTTIDLRCAPEGEVYRVAHDTRPEIAEFLPPAPPLRPFSNAVVEDPDSTDFVGGYLDVEIVGGAKDGDCLFIIGDAPGNGELVVENPSRWDPLALIRTAQECNRAPPDTQLPLGQGELRENAMNFLAAPDSQGVQDASRGATASDSVTRLRSTRCPSAQITLARGCAFHQPPPRISRRDMHRGRRASRRQSSSACTASPGTSGIDLGHALSSQNSETVGVATAQEQIVNRDPGASPASASDSGTPRHSLTTSSSMHSDNNLWRSEQGGAAPAHTQARPQSSARTEVQEESPGTRLHRIPSFPVRNSVPSNGSPRKGETPPAVFASPPLTATHATARRESGATESVAFASLLIRIEFGYCTLEVLQQLVRQIAFKPCGTHASTPKNWGKRDIAVRMVVGDPTVPKYRKFDPFVPVTAMGAVLVCEPLVQVSTHPVTYKEGSGAMALGQFTVCDESSPGYHSWNGGWLSARIVKGATSDDRIYIRSLDPNVSDFGFTMVEVDPQHVLADVEQRRPARKASSRRFTFGEPKNPDASASDGSLHAALDRMNCPGPPLPMLQRVRSAVANKEKYSSSHRTTELFASDRSFVGQLTAALSACHIGFRTYEKRKGAGAGATRGAQQQHQPQVPPPQQQQAPLRKSGSVRNGRYARASSARKDVLPSSVLAKLPPGATPIRRKDVQSLLKLLTYECRSANPTELRKIICVSISDGCPTSVTDLLIEVNVQPVDDATEIRRSTAGPVPFRLGFPGAFLQVFEHCSLFDPDTELFNGGFFVATLVSGAADGDELRLLSLAEQRKLRASRANDQLGKFRAAPRRPPASKLRRKGAGIGPRDEEEDPLDSPREVPDFLRRYRRPEEYEFAFDHETNSVFVAGVDEAFAGNNSCGAEIRVATFTLNAPKPRSGEATISVAFAFPALVDEENIDPDEDGERPAPVPLAMIEAMMKCIVYCSSEAPTKIRTGRRTFAARVSPGGGAEEGRIKIMAQVTPTLITFADMSPTGDLPEAVFRKRQGSIHPFARLLALADIQLKAGFVAVEIVDGFDASADILKVGELGTSRLFQLKSGGRALYTSKDLYCGGFTPIESDGALKGFVLNFEHSSRVSGSVVQQLLRSVAFSNTAVAPPTNSRRVVQVTLCDGTANETSVLRTAVVILEDEEVVEATWGQSAGVAVVVHHHRTAARDDGLQSPLGNGVVRPFSDLSIIQQHDEAGTMRVLRAPACLEIEGGAGDVLNVGVSKEPGNVSVGPAGLVQVDSKPIGVLGATLPLRRGNTNAGSATTLQSQRGSAPGSPLSRTPLDSSLMRLPAKAEFHTAADHDPRMHGSVSSSAGFLHESDDAASDSTGGTPRNRAVRSAPRLTAHRLRIRFDECEFTSLQSLLRAVEFQRPDGQGGQRQLRLQIWGPQGNLMLRLNATVIVTEPMFVCGPQVLSPVSELFPTLQVKFVPRMIRIRWQLSDAALTLSDDNQMPRLWLVINSRMGIVRKDRVLSHDKNPVGIISPTSIGGIPTSSNEFVIEVSKKASVLALQRLMRSLALAPDVQYDAPHTFTIDFWSPPEAVTTESLEVVQTKRRH